MRYYSDVLEKVEKRWVLSHVIVVLVLGTEGEDIWLYVSMCEDVGLKVWRVMWRSLYCWYVYMCLLWNPCSRYVSPHTHVHVTYACRCEDMALLLSYGDAYIRN